MAADQGNAVAQNNLGYCYQNGIGVDNAKFKQWPASNDAGKNQDILCHIYFHFAACNNKKTLIYIRIADIRIFEFMLHKIMITGRFI